MLRLIVGLVGMVGSYVLTTALLSWVQAEPARRSTRAAQVADRGVPVPERISPLLDLALTRHDEAGRTAAEVRRILASELATKIGPCWPAAEDIRWTPVETVLVMNGDAVRITAATALDRGGAHANAEFRVCLTDRLARLVANGVSFTAQGVQLLNLHDTIEETIVWRPRNGGSPDVFMGVAAAT